MDLAWLSGGECAVRGIFVFLSDMANGLGAHSLAEWLLHRESWLVVILIGLALQGLFFGTRTNAQNDPLMAVW